MKNPLIFQNCKLVFTDFFAEGSLQVENGYFTAVSFGENLSAKGAKVIDCRGDYLGPGFVDIHNHGALGTDFIDGEAGGLAKALQYHQKQGVTSVLATLITNPPKQISKAITRLVQLEKKKVLPKNFTGIHIEGPFLNPAKKGMHRVDWMHDPKVSEYKEWIKVGKGCVRLLTAAPERKGALEMYAWLRSQGVIGSIGHTILSWEEARSALAAGATHFVHLNNAMEWPTRIRNKEGWMQTEGRGMGSCLSSDLFTGEIIADGHHVSPELVRVILKAKRVDRVALVSDASPFTGLKPGRYTVATVPIKVYPSKLCLLADGSALASSVCTLLDMVRNLVGWGYGLLEAWRMASSTPAHLIGLKGRGAIRIGNIADLILLDSSLKLKGVWQQGEKVN